MIIILICIGFLQPNYSFCNEKNGIICIGPIPIPNSEAISLTNPSGGDRKFDFSVQIDNGRIIQLYFNKSVLYDSLAIDSKHLITIRNQGKIIQSFWFEFETYESESLCLWFKALYETWSLWPLNESNHLCSCNP